METIKVSSHSLPGKVAGALAIMLKENKKVTIQVIGAAALNQAIKAIAITRGYIIPSGVDLFVIPTFYDLVLNDEIVTSIRLIVELQ